MLFSLSRSKKEKIIGIIDIGSASVGGALVSLQKNGKPNIIYSVRENMVFQNDLNFERFTLSMLKTLENVLKQMKKSTKVSPSGFFYLLSSSWGVSATKMIKIEKTKPFIITQQTLEKLIKKEIDITSIIAKHKKMMEEGHEIIDFKNIQIKLNGYETATPYNKNAKIIEMALFVSVGSKKIIKSIKEKVFHVFRSNSVLLSSFLLVAFSTIRDIFTDKKDFILLDITGEVTDVAIIKNNVLVNTASFPLGKNFLIRRIVSNLNTIPEEAISLLNMYQSDSGNDTMRTKLNQVFLSAEKKWLLSFTKAVSGLTDSSSVPSSVFFTADTEVAKWFKTVIEKEEFAQFALAGKSFDVRFLDEKILSKFCSFSPNVHKDSFIILGAIFAAKAEKF